MQKKSLKHKSHQKNKIICKNQCVLQVCPRPSTLYLRKPYSTTNRWLELIPMWSMTFVTIKLLLQISVFSFFIPPFFSRFYVSHICGCPINSKKNKNQCKKTSNFATCPIMLGAINLTFSALYCSGNIYPLPFLLCFFLSNIYFNPPLSSTPHLCSPPPPQYLSQTYYTTWFWSLDHLLL